MTGVQNGESAVNSATLGVARALVVDDHELFRKGLRELIECEPGISVCGESDNEDDGFAKFRELKPDFVTIDVSAGGAATGLNLVSRIKKERSTAGILVISMYDERVFAERAVASGASGYVSKQAPNSEIVLVIRAVRNGEVYLRPDIMQRLVKRQMGSEKQAATGPLDQRLSDRELVILSLIGQGFSTQQIAGELHLAISTVETYRERIKSKLGLSSAAELIRHAVLWVMENA